MKQKTGKLTVITVLLLTVCIAAGAMGLPRLLGRAFPSQRRRSRHCPVPRCGSVWTSCHW